MEVEDLSKEDDKKDEDDPNKVKIQFGTKRIIKPATKNNPLEDADKKAEKPKIALNTHYKLSVLPDERVIDCLSFVTT